jgi:hypothetical protein
MVEITTMNDKPCGCEGTCHHGQFPLLRSLFEAPHIRDRLHTICALYYYSGSPAIRRGLLARLEDLTFEVAHLLAFDLLENGWRPEGASGRSVIGAVQRDPRSAADWSDTGWSAETLSDDSGKSGRKGPRRPSDRAS